jgi:hypothetical protein
MKRFCVAFSIDGLVESRVLKCDDEGCAVGILLDERGKDAPPCDWIRVERAPCVPAGVNAAFRAGLRGAR